MAGFAVCQPVISEGLGNGNGESSKQPHKAMLVDITKCVGCWFCYAACKRYNGFPETEKPDPETPPELTPDTWTTLFTLKKGGEWAYRKQACMHCTDAACVKVCPTGALSKNDLGFVQFDRDKCSGCGYCAEFCPFEVPQLESHAISGDAQMDKCTFCIDRTTNGEQTSCAEACPTCAIVFGNREELLEAGRARVEELRETNPNAHLYGDKELGGLHVMYVLDDTPEVWGLPADPELPLPAEIHDIVQWVGVGAALAMVGGFSLNYLVARMRIAREEKK